MDEMLCEWMKCEWVCDVGLYPSNVITVIYNVVLLPPHSALVP